MAKTLINPTQKEYIDFAQECTFQKSRIETIEVSGDKIYHSLSDDEKLIDGEVVSRLEDSDYIEELRNLKIKDITTFDKSSAVNEFFIDETSVWLDKATRMGIRINIEDAKKTDSSYMDVWSNDIKFSLSINDISNLIYDVEIYAKNCFDTTAQHKATVNKLGNADSIRNYDYKSGYPEKVYFSSINFK